MISIFIDTNIYLNFYHFSDDELEELKKLSVAIKKKDIKLYITRQVINEFSRNRESKIADALKRFRDQSLPSQFPNICRSYEEYKTMRTHLDGFKNEKNSLLLKLKDDIENKNLGADKIISEIFHAAEELEEDNEIVGMAKERVDHGNPPGKSSSYGDAINWLALLKQIPVGEDLYLVTEDDDYISKLDDYKLCDYLQSEWKAEKESQVFIYRKLSEFFKDKYPEIKLASQLEKEFAINAFINSSNFASTHLSIKNLAKYSDFTNSELNELARASVQNSQISRIKDDEDVKRFVNQIFEDNEEVIDISIYEKYLSIYCSSEPEDTNEDDMPF